MNGYMGLIDVMIFVRERLDENEWTLVKIDENR